MPKLKHKKSNPKTTSFQPNSKISNQSLISSAIPKSLSKPHCEPIHLKGTGGSGSSWKNLSSQRQRPHRELEKCPRLLWTSANSPAATTAMAITMVRFDYCLIWYGLGYFHSYWWFFIIHFFFFKIKFWLLFIFTIIDPCKRLWRWL